MSYGLTPYDKKNYRESKRRRKQALFAAKTGKIMPYGIKKRKAVIVTLICVAVVAVCVGVVTFFSITSKVQSPNTSVEDKLEYNEEELIRVVNRQNPLDSNFVPELKELGGISVNAMAYEKLLQMVDNAEKQGIELKIVKGYVSYEAQQAEYEAKFSQLMNDPEYTQVRAEAAAAKLVPKGGNSEFQTGLLVKFDFTDEKVKSFLELNCIENGFIQRYPLGKESLTFVNSDESIYRFVGENNAVKMRSYNMCLEEYRSYLLQQSNKFA